MTSPEGALGAGEVGVVLAVAGRRVVVVGDDEIGAAVSAAFARAGAHVTLVGSGAACMPLPAALAAQVDRLPRAYVRGDLAGAFAAVCLEDGEIAAAVAAEAESVSCLLCVRDRPDLSTFRFTDGFVSLSIEELA